MEACKNKKKEREDVGVELYGVQQELARHQMMLEKQHDEFAQKNQVNGVIINVPYMYTCFV